MLLSNSQVYNQLTWGGVNLDSITTFFYHGLITG